MKIFYYKKLFDVKNTVILVFCDFAVAVPCRRKSETPEEINFQRVLNSINTTKCSKFLITSWQSTFSL